MTDGPATSLSSALRDLESFAGPPASFWPALAEFLRTAASAREVTLIAAPAGSPAPSPLPLLARTPAARAGSAQLSELLAAAAPDAPSFSSTSRNAEYAAVVPLQTDSSLSCTAVLAWSQPLPPETAALLADLLTLLAPLPARYFAHRAAALREADLAWLGELLALLAELQEQTRFRAAALLVANFLADRFPRSEAALGWAHGNYVRVEAIAKRPEFNRQLEAVEHLEAALEECLTHDNELVCPPSADAGAVPPPGISITTPRESPLLHHHENLRRRTGAAQIVSVPLRSAGRLVGAFLLQLPDATLDAQALRSLRLLADQVTPPLLSARARDGSWFAQVRRVTENQLRRHWNLEHPWPKLGLISLVLVPLLLAVIPAPHRVEAPFRLQARAQAQLPAPFDGYVRAVHAETAATVAAGDTLAELDTTELEFERARTLADLSRARAEAENARGEDRLAAVRIAQAQADQARASLALIEQRLANARLTAPFAAIVVDDADLATKLGSPVRAGEPLYRIARLDQLIVDLQADETDFPYLKNGLTGEIAFASRPAEAFPIRVVALEPLATPGDAGNTFLIRAEPAQRGADWWRPGMTGVAKLDIGRRSVLWLLTHRALDWLRLKLWW